MGESKVTDKQRKEFYKKNKSNYPEGGASDKTIKQYFEIQLKNSAAIDRALNISRERKRLKAEKDAEKAKNQKVTTTEEKTPVKKTKPEKTKELKTHELSRVYTKPSKVQEMHRRRRKGGKSFTRQGASKLIDKTDKITIYNMNKADKAVEIREVANEKGKKYEKDLTSGGSRGSALTATGGSRVEYENKPGDKPGKAWIKTSKIPSITKQMELYRQNRKRKKRGR